MSNTNIHKSKTGSKVKKTCPTCLGKGFYEEVEELSRKSKDVEESKSELGLGGAMRRAPTQTLMRTGPIANKGKKDRGPEGKDPSLPSVGRPPSSRTPRSASGPRGDMKNTPSRENDLPQLGSSKGSELSIGSRDDDPILPPAIEIDKPFDFMQKTINKLKSKDWETLREGLEDAVQVVRSEGVCVEGMNRALLASIAAPRKQLLRTGLKAVKEVFDNSESPIQRPEFDELVNGLLGKMADKNETIRDDAMEALRSIMLKVSVRVAVRSITEKAPRHKNPSVREAAGRLLLEAVTREGPSELISGTGGGSAREARRLLLTTASNLFDDPNRQVRALAKQIFELIVIEPDFDDVFTSDVESAVARKIEKQLVLLRYGKAKT